MAAIRYVLAFRSRFFEQQAPGMSTADERRALRSRLLEVSPAEAILHAVEKGVEAGVRSFPKELAEKQYEVARAVARKELLDRLGWQVKID